VIGAVTSGRDPVVVIRIDLRTSATGPDAVEADSFGPDTLVTIQRGAVNGAVGSTDPQSRFVDVGRILVVDDTATFAKHAAAYQHLVAAPTVGQLLCLVVGVPVECALTGLAPGEPVLAEPVINLPPAVTSTNINAAVIWVGDPRGVGWRPGRQTTTRLAVGHPDDPDGTAALAELTGMLTEHQLFDRVFVAVSELPRHVAAPATLPTIRWPALPPADPPAPIPVVIVPPARRAARWPLIAALLALGCALIALIPHWEIALALWVAGLALAALVEHPRPQPTRLSRHGALVAAATTIGTAVGAATAATADPLGHLGVPAAAADSGSAALGAAALIAAVFIWWTGFRRPRRQRTRGGLPHTRIEAGPEDDLAAELRAVIAAACRTISAGAEDEDFLQLNAPEQLPLLAGVPQQARLVAFAPEAARETIIETMAEDVVGTAVAGNDVEWTTSGDRVGNIRLVPVRPGTLRTSGVSADPAKTVVIIDVTGGGDRARGRLAEWLHDDELDTRVLPSDDDSPLTLRLPDETAAITLTEGITDWLRGTDDEAAVTFTHPDGSAETLTAAAVQAVTDEEMDVLVARIANWLTR
jgi:hypothetical protein